MSLKRVGRHVSFPIKTKVSTLRLVAVGFPPECGPRGGALEHALVEGYARIIGPVGGALSAREDDAAGIQRGVADPIAGLRGVGWERKCVNDSSRQLLALHHALSPPTRLIDL